MKSEIEQNNIPELKGEDLGCMTNQDEIKKVVQDLPIPPAGLDMDKGGMFGNIFKD